MVASETLRVDFLCVENAGRSQMAAAFAEREASERGLEDVVEIHSAGTKPADEIHDTVVEAMAEVDIDISDRSPNWVVVEELEHSHFVITMGCTINEFNPSAYGVEHRKWGLVDPGGEDMETVRAVRDELERRVDELFDEIEDVARDLEVRKSLSKRVTQTIRNALSFR
jgi:protein-tyrosine-phosphatase